MPIRNVLSIVAGVLQVAGFVPYIRATVRRETEPAKASWLIWAILDTITIAGMYAEDTVNGQILGAVIGVWVVVVFAMMYGKPGWTKLDKVCLGGALLGIVLWRIFSSPILGITTSLIVTFTGAIPTFVSAWKDPSHEDKLAWTIFWVACVFAVVAIPQWTMADAAQPITFFIIESVMMYILYFRSQPQNKI